MVAKPQHFIVANHISRCVVISPNVRLSSLRKTRQKNGVRRFSA
jgi:hypothetical protein